MKQKSPQKFDKFKKYIIIYLYLYFNMQTKCQRQQKEIYSTRKNLAEQRKKKYVEILFVME
jgi:hypothetical protein